MQNLTDICVYDIFSPPVASRVYLYPTIAAYEVFKAQLDKYDDLEPDMDFLNEYSKRNNNLDFAGKIRLDSDNDATFAFGKYTGQKVVDVFKIDLGYYSWIMKGDFPEYTKKIFTKLKLSIINSK